MRFGELDRLMLAREMDPHAVRAVADPPVAVVPTVPRQRYRPMRIVLRGQQGDVLPSRVQDSHGDVVGAAELEEDRRLPVDAAAGRRELRVDDGPVDRALRQLEPLGDRKSRRSRDKQAD